MHEYKAKDISACLQSRRVIYVGDSTTRQIFWATAKKLDKEAAEDSMLAAEKHGDLSFTSAGVQVEFIWDPFLNSSKLHEELVAYRDVLGDTRSDTSSGTDSAALILIGAGLWHARHVEVSPLKVFQDAVDSIMPFMSPTANDVVVGAAPQPFVRKHGARNLLLFAPVQVPLYESLSPSRAASIVSEKIKPMNDYLQQLSVYQGADVVWSYSLMTRREKFAYEESGLHVVENVANRKADVLLNLRCNAEAANSGRYPFDRTCCSNYRRPGWVQWAVLVAGLGLLPLVTMITSKGRHNRVASNSRVVLIVGSDYRRAFMLPSSKHAHALLAFSSAVCYCFYADRTQIFNKTQKQYSSTEFMVFCGITLALGVLSIGRSISPTALKSVQRTNQRILDQPFLPRDQTEEWKGWMQFIILIYHYTGASKVLWIYELVRLLVASYLFMTGFGHTVYFYKKGDYSLRRVASVLVRLNLLSCVLPYVMRTDYLFYYFGPLVSFWFMVIYCTMKVGQSRNDNLSFLFSKIIISAIMVIALIRTPGLLEAIFFILEKTCRIHWNITEWRFRVFLDIFIVYVGMISGVLFVHISAALSSERLPTNAFIETVQHHFFYIRITLTIAALAVLPGFWALTRRSPDKYDYNRWQPYISCIPILSFVLLRNAHRHLRNFHSSIFAWLGRCSLETFTLQFHIWLAGDTKGLLSVGVFERSGTPKSGRREDFVVLTAIFLWTSWCVAGATGVLTSWIVDPGEEKHEVKLDGTGDEELKRFMELPRSKVDNQHNDRSGTGGRNVARWMSFVSKAFKEDLRVRLGVLLASMWLANVVSPPSNMPSSWGIIIDGHHVSQTYT